MTWPNTIMTLNVLNCVDLELMTKEKSGPARNQCDISTHQTLKNTSVVMYTDFSKVSTNIK